MNNNVALIPARSGSKRVINKNISQLEGHPLIAYSITSALNSNQFDDVIVSTDSQEIKEVSEYYGASVPFLRPEEYSQDKSPDIEWVKHSLNYLSKYKEYEVFSILRPTSPFRKPETIKRALKLFLQKECDSLRAVEKCLQHPCKMWEISDDYMTPFVNLNEKGPKNQPLHSSQYPSLPEVYVQNASLEIAYVKTVYDFNNISGEKIIPFITERDEGFDVNVKDDWELAKILIKNGEASLPNIKKKAYSK
tara:strand:- start:1663 stop:2412 length:750 start_codon:yes stop_codon:yes gene_type:complete